MMSKPNSNQRHSDESVEMMWSLDCCIMVTTELLCHPAVRLVYIVILVILVGGIAVAIYIGVCFALAVGFLEASGEHWRQMVQSGNLFIWTVVIGVCILMCLGLGYVGYIGFKICLPVCSGIKTEVQNKLELGSPTQSKPG